MLKKALNTLMVILGCWIFLTAHTPLVSASVNQRGTNCPINTALLAFTSPFRLSKKLGHTSLVPRMVSVNDIKPSQSSPMDVHVIGVSIHHADVDVREKLSIKQEDWASAAAELVNYSSGVVEEAAVLSTCNRFELYIASRDGRSAIRSASSWLSSRSDLPQSVLRKQLFLLSGDDASWHLLRVSAGLDSLVVGEGQILSQVNACHQAAIQKADDVQIAGSGGKVLSKMFNTAVTAGKRVRAETSIAKGAVSISSAAVEFSKLACPRDLKKSLAESKVVIVGAGNMTKLLITHLKSQGVNAITLVSRGLGPGSNAADIVAQYPDMKWTLMASCDLYKAMQGCDLAFFSTSATRLLLTAQAVEEHVGVDRKFKSDPLCIIDISVPRNVDPAIVEVQGCHVYNVDHLKDAVARNTANRRLEMLEAEALLKEELSRYQGWHQSLGVVPKILKLQEAAEQIRVEEIAKNSNKLKNLSEKELEVVGRLTKGIVNKLLHRPLTHLRAIEDMESKRRTLSTFSALFKLDEPDKP